MPDSPWNIGDVVQDREDDDPDPAIVVNVPGAPANEWDVPRFGKTVAEDNPDYPADALIVTVLFEDNLNYSFPDWERDNKISYNTLDERGPQYYSFPAPRLESTEPTTSTEATEPDTEADANSAPNDETTSSSITTEEHSSASADSNADTSTEDTPAEPSAVVRALEARLKDGGMTTELEADGRTIRATKLGDTYRVRPGEVLDGDGPLLSRLEEIVS